METSENLKYLMFSLNEERFAIPLLSVREVLAMPEITKVPQTPDHFMGIMNLRGQVISIIDMRLKLGIKPKNNSESAVIICDMKPNFVGVVVDSIDSVVEIEKSQISEKPQIHSHKKMDYIIGIFKNEDELVFILDISLSLDAQDINIIKKTI